MFFESLAGLFYIGAHEPITAVQQMMQTPSEFFNLKVQRSG